MCSVRNSLTPWKALKHRISAISEKATGVTRMLSTGFKSVPKPPNILIYQPDKDLTNSNFIRTKQSLELCIAPERYVLYPLGSDDVIMHTPWKDNCKLLVMPPMSEEDGVQQGSHGPHNELSPCIIEEVCAYAQSGGAILSLHSQLNNFLGIDGDVRCIDSRNSESDRCMVEVHQNKENYQFPCLLPNARKKYKFEDVFLQVPLSDSVENHSDVSSFYVNKLQWEKSNFNQSNNSADNAVNILLRDSKLQESGHFRIPCIRTLLLKNEGRIVLSNVDLLPVLPTGLSLELLMEISSGVPQRKQLLSTLLNWFGMECSKDKLPDLSHTFLVCSDKHRDVFLNALSSLDADTAIPGQEVSLRLLANDYCKETPVDELPRPSHNELTVITRPAKWQIEQLPFSVDSYFAELKTREIGRTLLHTPVITSTMLPFTGNMSFCQALSSEMGVAWVAAQQTCGKGRSGNAWISPVGSMMFTLPLPLSPTSRLAHHMPLLQHMVAVAVVHGIRSLPEYKEVPFRIKWPNDIYYDGRVKLGGILVSCVTMGQICTAIVGCGVNVNNVHPTISVNKTIELFNHETGSSLPPLSVEQTLARTFNCLERLLSMYELEGVEPILELYYKYWLHSGCEVFLSGYEEERATVTGIDKYGYLQVLRKSGETVSLQPDGNSFDITRGLIVMKTK